MESARFRLFLILHKPAPTHALTRYVNYLLAGVILMNCAAVALETVPAIHEPNRNLFRALEFFSTVFFIIEYLLRLWVCVERPEFSAPVSGRLRYALRPLPLLDLIVILTLWAPWDLRFLRIFRLSRLLQVLHLEGLDHSLQAVLKAIRRRKSLLAISLLMMAITIYCLASLLYFVEHAAQPQVFSSIPATLWWSVVTLTTIGYGDMAPITALGKTLAGIVMLVGIGVFALPTAIVTAAILEAGVDSLEKSGRCGSGGDSAKNL